jgi:ribonuclease HI
MGVGIVIRDDEGQVLVAKAFIIPYVVDLAIAEATATWHAICFGREVGGSRVVLEGDSKVVIIALKGRGSSNHTYGNLIEATQILFSSFTFVEVSHVKR